MAFNLKTNNVTPLAKATTGTWERALGFINLLVPNTFGALNLMASNANQQGLFDALLADTSGALLKSVCSNLAVDFNPNKGQAAWSFLDSDEPLDIDPSKPLGYVNFYLPDEAGEMVQLGKVSLWAKDAREQQLFNVLNESTERCEAVLAKFLKSLTLSFYPNKTNTVKRAGFALLKAA